MSKIVVDIPASLALVDLWRVALVEGWTLIFPRHLEASEDAMARFPDAIRASDWVYAVSAASDPDYTVLHPSFGYLIHSGGTTGTPRLVYVTAHNVRAYLAGAIRAYGMRRGEGGRMALICAPGVDGAAEECLLAIYCRKLVVPCPRNLLVDPIGFWRWVEHERLDLLSMPTAMFERLLASRAWSSDRAMRVIVGGEPLLTEHARTFLRRAPRASLINSYGPPETTIAVSAKTLTSRNIADVTTDVVPIGSPFAHVELWRTADGRLVILGAQVAGYLGEPRRASFTTGDLVDVEDGEWRFCGRSDGIERIRGYRVDLLDVETTLPGLSLHPQRWALTRRPNG